MDNKNDGTGATANAISVRKTNVIRLERELTGADAEKAEKPVNRKMGIHLMQPPTPSEAGTLAEPLLGNESSSLTGSSEASFNPDTEATPYSHATLKYASTPGTATGKSRGRRRGASASGFTGQEDGAAFVEEGRSLGDELDADDDINRELSFEELAYIILNKSLLAKY